MIPAVMHWSSGKDATFALHQTRRAGRFDIRAVLSTVNEPHGRVAIHGVRRAVLAAQARALGLPLIEVPLPYGCTNEIYLERMNVALDQLAKDGLQDHIFGDILLEDVRVWREKMLTAHDLNAHFPLWGLDTATVARDMLSAGIAAHVVTLDPAKLSDAQCGTAFDTAFLDGLPQGVDPCGENGEFHTLVSNSPDFAAPLDLRRGETVTRDGFVYTDFTLATPHPAHTHD
ncbi:ATP-binding protein [Aliiroseovarius sediminis]|uniref:Dph6-related ATP pyrophosphatase n=1 Tax=Aliiroseovarius sediminis TaxID=2925839 RepID=UPI001F59CF66|nr:ATP-binding protein [Aliiroseovarius sediminis]MCI2393974.1 ATP-binding protein [Aliiroseovarius sediminis]